jgi:hypothetical protein
MIAAAESASDYYRDPHVRARLLEYFGSEADHGPTAVYAAGLDPSGQRQPTWAEAIRVPTDEFFSLCDRGFDVSRSLWDTRALIFVIDLDYQNLDYPSEPFTHASDVFFKLEPAYEGVRAVLRHFGISTLTLATGRGYHFVGQIPLDAPVTGALAELAAVPTWLDGLERRSARRFAVSLGAQHARAATGLTLVLEYIAHAILRETTGRTLIPVVLNGTTVGSGLAGRECISIDFSHGGDPLDERVIRMAFSTYQWHRARPDIFGAEAAARPPLATVPREDVPLTTFLLAGRDLRAAPAAAAVCQTTMPTVSRGIEHALADYRGSLLACFHREFIDECRAREDPPPVPTALAPCLVRPLRQPNDLLLKPEYLQNLVRGLLAHGWRASQIAELVHREYTRDHQWGDRWTRLDARTRAEFDVRVFAGLVITGGDELVDFNCTSAQEKSVCPFVGCHHDLREDRERLRLRYPQ